MSDARVLVDLAEEILAVDELERASPERLERQPQPREFRFLVIGNEANQLDPRKPSELNETLA